MSLPEPKFGPSGELVYRRTYSRPKADGTQEEWHETVERVVRGNMALVYGDDESAWSADIRLEAAELATMIYEFKLLPAGRHLWSCGAPGATHLFNCWAAPTDDLVKHVQFMITQLMQGGGVGSAYGLEAHNFGPPPKPLELHLVCDPAHPDHAAMRTAGVLSEEYADTWTGAYEIGDSREGWSDALTDLIRTYYRADVRHTKRVYDLAQVRPAGARLKTFGGTASGPLPLAEMLHTVSRILNAAAVARHHLTGLDVMSLDHAIASAVVAGGVRRSARMSVMRWDDPEVYRFIDCKRDVTGAHFTTNISVAVDDAFFASAAKDGTAARRILDKVVEGMLHNGEPGLWHVENANRKEIKRSWTPNPCSEVELEPYEPCCLGQVNLAAFTHGDYLEQAREMTHAHRLMTRFLIRATYAPVTFPESRKILDANRRIGVGHTGVQEYLVRSGMRYSEAGDSAAFEMLLTGLKRVVDQTAANYAYELRIPLPIKRTALAPTGSISKLPGVTEGIAPIFGKWYVRRIRFSRTNPEQIAQVEEYRSQGYTVEDDVYAADTVVVSFPMRDPLLDKVSDPSLVEDQDQISLDARLALQELYQRTFVDLAISNTITLDPEHVSAQELRNAILRWMPSLKGVTCFPKVSMPQAPYEKISEEEFNALTAPKGVDSGYDEECANGSCPIR